MRASRLVQYAADDNCLWGAPYCTCVYCIDETMLRAQTTRERKFLQAIIDQRKAAAPYTGKTQRLYKHTSLIALVVGAIRAVCIRIDELLD